MEKTSCITLSNLKKKLGKLEGKSFQDYQELRNAVVCYDSFSLKFLHIQGSPGANPASVCRLTIKSKSCQLPSWVFSSPARTIAAKDFILRAFNEATVYHAKQNRGVDGSGSFQTLKMPQQVLVRNIVQLSAGKISLLFRLSLPGNRSNHILASEAEKMFFSEIPAIVTATNKKLNDHSKLKSFCETVEDMLFIQEQLERENLVAFIADNSKLPRESGVSDLPAQGAVVPFKATEECAVYLDFPNAGKVRGLGIRAGVTVLIGGGFHGKSTLLNAIALGVYPHITGDGREKVISNKNSVFICAEDGRAINNLDISGFISDLPNGSDVKKFKTKNASGSTSQAAAIIENICAGAQFLLIDEDNSATNLLIRDNNMRKLIPNDPITPLFDRVSELHKKNNISTLIIAGGISNYIGIADQVIAMQNYRPTVMTEQAKALNIPSEIYKAKPLKIIDNRRVAAENFDPSYENIRLKKKVPVRIKPLRTQEKDMLEFGQDLLDLRKLAALVDNDQLSTIGYALLLAKNRLIHHDNLSPSKLATRVLEIIEKEELDCLQCEDVPPLFFSHIRKVELAGAINRLRSLKVT